MRTIRAPERLGKTVSLNCSQNFHGIWSPKG
uniref:RNA cytidine acetyltransferase 1-like n=1 Tax=Rhizophora mucronata TaxID=61149 RepID=A0A2P2M6G0_RHIMU